MPRTFCITLRETPLRTKGFLESANKAGLEVEMFNGVLGNRTGLVPKFPNELECNGKNILMTEGGMGCSFSHLLLWNILKYMPGEEFLILEDDAIIELDFKEKFAEVYAKLPNDWEMAYVGWVPNGNNTSVITVEKGLSIRLPGATHAYLIKKSIINKLCDSFFPLQSNIDLTIQDRVLPHVKYYVFDPSIVTQRSYLNTTDPTWASMVYDWKSDLYGQKRQILRELKLKSGWHMTERAGNDYWRWSMDKFTISVPKLANSLQIVFSVPGNNNLLIFSGEKTLDFELKEGDSNITIPVGENDITGKLETTYVPSQVISNNYDNRCLGICLKRVIVNIGITSIPIEIIDL